MTYKELKKIVDELDDRVEKARGEAYYEVRRLEADLSYEGENREPVDAILEQLRKTQDTIKEYIRLCDEYVNLTERNIED